MNHDLLKLLAARQGLVCLVGAGGKKTTLYRLAALHPGKVAMTTTVHINHFPADLPAYRIIGEAEELEARVVAAARLHRQVAYGRPSAKPNRLAGVEPAQVAALHRAGGFDLTLVKADGARARLVKAPGPREPCIAPDTTTVIALVSAHILRLPLSQDNAHRPDRLAEVTGVLPGEVLSPQQLGALLASPEGSLKGIGGARVVGLINMVDDDQLADRAYQAAQMALERAPKLERVVLAAMNRPPPVVAVVERREL